MKKNASAFLGCSEYYCTQVFFQIIVSCPLSHDHFPSSPAIAWEGILEKSIFSPSYIQIMLVHSPLVNSPLFTEFYLPTCPAMLFSSSFLEERNSSSQHDITTWLCRTLVCDSRSQSSFRVPTLTHYIKNNACWFDHNYSSSRSCWPMKSFKYLPLQVKSNFSKWKYRG